MAVPDPANVAPWYLRNITQALELNESTGQVFLRTSTSNVTVGNLSVGNVGIASFGNIPIGGNTLPVSGNVTVLQGTTPWVITGNTNVVITSGNVGLTGNLAGITGNVTIVDGGGSITVDGNVNANVSGNVGIVGNVNVTQGTTPWSVAGNVGITGTANVVVTGGNVATTITGTNLDAFGRLRVSEPYTLFDSQNLYLDGGQFSNITSTGGAVAYVQAESSFNLSVTAANNSSVINQSRTTQAYQPGKSLLTLNTFAFATLTAGCRQRVGYFTANNGVYFEADGADLYLVIRSSATGAIAEERILQADWNGDTLSGAGGSTKPSGIELDPTLVQIFWADIEWLGVGTVRSGFVINGEFIVCHRFNHANQPGNTRVYMTTATLNPRYEITNTSATAGARTMKQICSTVISEGGYNPVIKQNYVSGGIRPTRITTGNVYTNLVTVRLNPAYIDAVVVPAQIDLLLTDVQYGSFQLVLNASNAAGLTYANISSSVVQSNVSAVQIGDGEVLYAGLTSSRDTVTIASDLQRRLQLSRTANGTPETLTLCVGYGSNNADVIWKFGWQEVTN
jgi:hypothetical protein